MNNKILFSTLRNVLALCLTLCSGLLSAQVDCVSGPTCTQSITLTPGWNSIYVQVEPQQDATTQVFADLLDGAGPQISSVWTWLAHRAKIDFVQDPDPENLLSQPGWLRFFPAQASQAILTNLHSIQANRAYLVKLEGTQNTTLTISGLPVVPRTKWQSNSFNHLGFHVDPQNLPTFADFFASSLAHKEQPVYQLVNDAWEKVDPLSTIIQPDVAYWVFSKTGSEYTGPMQVELPQLDRLEYSDVIMQLTAKLKNISASEQSISLQVLGNPAGMYYPNPDLTAEQNWLPLPNPLTKNIAIGGEVRIPLGIRRADFNLGNFNHTLQITSEAGSRWLIPVTASAPQLNSLWVGSVTIDSVSQVQNYQRNCVESKVPKTFDTYDDKGQPITLSYDEFAPNYCDAGAPKCSDSGGTIYTNTEATGFELCRNTLGFPVSVAAVAGEPLPPVKPGSEFSFRVILHREGTQIRLLKDVIQMWKNPVTEADGSITPGRYVLLTDDSLLSNYDGVALRDGEIVGRRMSSIAYDFSPPPRFPDDLNLLHDPNNPNDVHDPNDPGDVHDPNDPNNLRYPVERTYTHDMTGALDSQLQTRLVLAGNAPSNPFRHHYHNAHKGQGYAITRTMTFDYVAPELAEGVTTLGVGRETIQGTYSEVIEGLHKEPIVVSGTYILRHALAVNTLNQ